VKVYLLSIFLGLLTLLSACVGTPEPVQLDIPSNFSIDGTVLVFDEVEHASRYRIETTNLETSVEKKYFVTIDQDLSLLYLVPGDYDISIQAVGDGKNFLDSEYSEAVSYTQIDPYAVSEISGEFLTDVNMVRWFGRTHYLSTNNANYFYFTASGFEVTFYGTSLEAELVTGANASGKEPHLVVFLDGETNPLVGTLLVMDQPKKTYTLIDGLDEGIHTVRVLKRSESIDSTTALSKISTDGYFMPTNALRTRKIEVIAASSSAGFGNLAANTSVAKTTQNSDGLRAYAYLASRMLDAEINIFSASGWPLLKGPWTGTNNIPQAYEFVNVYSSVSWSHQNYVPDVVVINLGTNDWSYITTLSGAARTQAILDFENAFVDFIEHIHDIHPNATIVIAYGLMNETNIYTPTINAVNQAKINLPTVNIFSIQLPSVNATDGIGSSNHPSVVTHIKAAQELAEALEVWMDWNIVRPNIS
jgi:hypothetical protein